MLRVRVRVIPLIISAPFEPLCHLPMQLLCNLKSDEVCHRETAYKAQMYLLNNNVCGVILNCAPLINSADRRQLC